MVIPITIAYGLPFVEVVLVTNGRQVRFANVLLDTGAGGTVFKTDDLNAIGVLIDSSDQVRFISGVGGREPVVEKQIDAIQVGDLHVSPFTIQISALDYGFTMDGILGMDFMRQVGLNIDLRNLVITGAS